MKVPNSLYWNKVICSVSRHNQQRLRSDWTSEVKGLTFIESCLLLQYLMSTMQTVFTFIENCLFKKYHSKA